MPYMHLLSYPFTSFYNLVTDFYEYGWGQSFHFAPRQKDETFRESIRRAEYVLASRIEVRDACRPGLVCVVEFAETARHTLLRWSTYSRCTKNVFCMVYLD